MVEYISLILLLVLILPKLGFSLKDSNSMSLQNSTNLRGLLCVLIFLNHLAGWYEDQGIIFYFFSHIGSFVVGVFFFLSGFGLIKTYNGEVKTGFLIKRFVKLFIPYWICEFLYAAISVCFSIPIQVEVNLKNILLSAVQMSNIVENSWYVGASVVIYLAFFIGKKILPKISMTIKVTALLIVFSLVFHSFWTTFFAFPVGIFFGENEKKINALSNKKRSVAIGSLILVCVAAIVLKYYGNAVSQNIYMDVSEAITSVVFAALVYFVFTFLHIGNRALGFLGKISYEFYLMHGLGMRVAYRVLGTEYGILFAIISLMVTLVLSYFVSLISSLIINPIDKRIR